MLLQPDVASTRCCFNPCGVRSVRAPTPSPLDPAEPRKSVTQHCTIHRRNVTAFWQNHVSKGETDHGISALAFDGRRGDRLGSLMLLGIGRRPAQQPTPEQTGAIRASCRSDFMANCSGVTPGGKDALECLKRNLAKLSGGMQDRRERDHRRHPHRRPLWLPPAGSRRFGAAPATPAAAPAMPPAAAPKPAPAAAAAKPAPKPAAAIAPAPPPASRRPRRPRLRFRRSGRFGRCCRGARLMIIAICRVDAQTLCAGAPPIGPAVLDCLAEKAASLSPDMLRGARARQPA